MSSVNDYDSLQVYFDGACWPNPGIASYGWLIKAGNEQIACGSAMLEGNKRTNNFAEYCGLGFALRYLVDHRYHGNLDIYGDSRLVVKQMQQKKPWKSKKPHLTKLRDRCKQLLKQIGGKYTIQWIPREQNEECDSLAESVRL